MTRIITADEIIACYPCPAWPHARIRALVGDGLTPIALARLDVVPLVDRRWALAQVLARRDRVVLVRWACDVASDSVRALTGELRDASEACLSATLAWCEGGSLDDVREARAWLSVLRRCGGVSTYAAAAYAACAAAYATCAATAAAATDAAAYAATAADQQDHLDALAAYYQETNS